MSSNPNAGNERSEKEKMIAGELYRAADPQLVAERRHARRLVRQYNESDDVQERIKLLSQLFHQSGPQIEVEPPFRCDYGYNISVGDSFYANFGCVMLDVCKIEIGRNVMLGPNVQIYTASHPLDPEERNSGVENGKPIKIGDSVWIGGGAIINPGVTIGEGTTIGSGSVVTKDIPAHVVAVGNPCRVIKHLKPQ